MTLNERVIQLVESCAPATEVLAVLSAERAAVLEGAPHRPELLLEVPRLDMLRRIAEVRAQLGWS